MSRGSRSQAPPWEVKSAIGWEASPTITALLHTEHAIPGATGRQEPSDQKVVGLLTPRVQLVQAHGAVEEGVEQRWVVPASGAPGRLSVYVGIKLHEAEGSLLA
eukprot:1195913-Prorocentrum_minimum.AAC.4